ncbi:hypothetical protein Barb6XT_01167 [Bacteroidales bacterium Barb6XT]|nr:hypothetical protein Barb6XT_01167 [Bacteroidales bacterium Barb6XT]
MRTYELLDFNKELLEKLHVSGIKSDDYKYAGLYMGHYGGYTLEDFENLLQLLTTVRGKFMLSSYPSDILTSHCRKSGLDSN